MAPLSPEVEAALHDIEAVITRHLDVLTSDIPGIESAAAMLGDWGVVYHITDMNDGGSWITGMAGPGMAWHHWTGLLDAALDDAKNTEEEL